jgi:hypothetical protein
MDDTIKCCKLASSYLSPSFCLFIDLEQSLSMWISTYWDHGITPNLGSIMLNASKANYLPRSISHFFTPSFHLSSICLPSLPPLYFFLFTFVLASFLPLSVPLSFLRFPSLLCLFPSLPLHTSLFLCLCINLSSSLYNSIYPPLAYSHLCIHAVGV